MTSFNYPNVKSFNLPPKILSHIGNYKGSFRKKTAKNVKNISISFLVYLSVAREVSDCYFIVFINKTFSFSFHKKDVKYFF